MTEEITKYYALKREEAIKNWTAYKSLKEQHSKAETCQEKNKIKEQLDQFGSFNDEQGDLSNRCSGVSGYSNEFSRLLSENLTSKQNMISREEWHKIIYNIHHGVLVDETMLERLNKHSNNIYNSECYQRVYQKTEEEAYARTNNRDYARDVAHDAREKLQKEMPYY